MKKMDKVYWLVLLSTCGAISVSLGLIVNITGLFFNPIAEEFGLLRGSVSLTLTLSNFLSALGGMMMPKLLSEKHLKVGILLATIGGVCSTILLGLSQSILFMYFLHMIRGFCAGLLGLVFITVVINNWFHENVGLMTSIALSFSGLSGAIFSPIISNVINNYGWRMGYFVVALFILLLDLPSLLFLPSLKPQTKGYLPYGYVEEENPSTLQTTSTTSISQIYFVICCMFGFIASGSTSLIQHFPGISSSYGFNAAVGAMMLSIGMVANSVAKIILGYLIDHFGSKKPILLHCLIMILSVLLFLFFHTPTMLYISAFLYGYIYSLANVAMVTLAKDLFGRDNYSKTYPTFSMFGTVGTAVSASGIGYIYDFTHSYTPVFLLLLGLFIMNTLFVLYCYRKPIQ